ncbi:bifunctional 5,10-methylene-tetrahydrofolate dehydrogenase/ 5,10-methylene-tetrahydrofolate [Candidatus Phycorickettsia trachydisci]|uniref:Bifunctional protein FolD n=1 Tax=Candidatus Phycorickettsia trachydisci TaxID=2115978 RepID=A0A2P1P8K2_9RICK|nr:bifunctional 5,10-methylenetetrahydrofolate dehydrogenase/5,10-methenyltetrahydrofolate cyclohydrolase [Candidatus Phycorickettsia trachydisci]AVP87591.1 bifunctional 5,10-methylene-tetrahydrofolate dehydrogenase/ 5,10-methylene-tetrahydrofolate [Candidatus Phycorickettsia trachydisci]
MIIIDGKKIAQEILDDLKSKIVHIKPKLAIILIGDNPASQIYVGIKIKQAANIGIDAELIRLPAEVDQEVLFTIISELNIDPKVHGIIVQLPVPLHLNVQEIFNTIHPAKDVDGLNPINIGKLYSAPRVHISNDFNYEYTLYDYFIPCTALGILRLIREVSPNIGGLHIAIVNRSNLIGKPLAGLLMQRDATVTICHSYSKNLSDITSAADIVVCAIGKKDFFDRKYFKKGAIVIDVGINKGLDGDVTGDVNFDDVKSQDGFITPVPGGVGPLTVAYLLSNTYWAASNQTL